MTSDFPVKSQSEPMESLSPYVCLLLAAAAGSPSREDGLVRMSFLRGLRNQLGRRVLSTPLVTSRGRDASPTDRLTPDRLADVFNRTPPATSGPGTSQPPHEVSTKTPEAGPSADPQPPGSLPDGAFDVPEPVESRPKVSLPTLPLRVVSVPDLALSAVTLPAVTLPAVTLPAMPGDAAPVPGPAVPEAGRHRRPVAPKPTLRRFAITFRRAALFAPLLVLVVIGALFALK